MSSGVYQLRCTATGERYIGSSANLAARASMHRSQLRLGKHQTPRIRELAAEHGPDSIVFEVLEECPPEATLGREAHWIQTTAPELNTNTENIGGRRPIGRERININLPKGMADALNDAAAEKGWDRSRLIEELADGFLKRRAKEKGKEGEK